MSNASQIIADAYREGNLIQVGTDPTTAQVEEGLRLLNRFIQSLYGWDMGEPLLPLNFGGGNVTTPELIPFTMDDIVSYYVPSNTRLICNLTAAKTINLDPNPVNGQRFGVIDVAYNFATYPLTIKGNGRLINGAVQEVESDSGFTYDYVYNDSIGSWQAVNDLEEFDDSPFPEEFDDLLIIGLAMRLNPRHGTAISSESVDRYKTVRNIFRARYRQKTEMPSEAGLYRLPSNKNYQTFDSNSGVLFNRGYPWLAR